MGEVTKPVAQWISNNIPLSVGLVIFLFCLLFEISKVKIYPLRWLWKLITWPFRKAEEQRTTAFKALIADLKKDIDATISEMHKESMKESSEVKEGFLELKKRFDNLDAKQAEAEERLDMLAAARIKNHVLNFARQCRKGEPHSHEDFSNLFAENREYQLLVEKYGWDNEVYKHDYAYVLRVYDECNDKGLFISEVS